MHPAHDDLVLARGPSPWWRPSFDRGRHLVPGLMLCGTVALASAFLETRWGGARVLYALLIGMAFHEFSTAPRQRQGVDFAAQTLLRLGIGLLGARISLHEASVLGWPVLLWIAAGVASTLALVAAAARAAGLPWRIGVIAGGATAICGASAALAISACLARDKLCEQRTLAVVVCATTLSTLAMLSYPLLCAWMALPPDVAGLMLGGSIHDVAQVAVAGYALGPQAGDTAIVVKLVRVGMLSAVVMGIAAFMRWQRHAGEGLPSSTSRPALLPWFMQLFVLLAVLQSCQALPSRAGQLLSDTSQTSLVIAAAALGMRSSLALLRQAGWRIMLPMAAGSIWLALTMLGGGLWLHRH